MLINSIIMLNKYQIIEEGTKVGNNILTVDVSYIFWKGVKKKKKNLKRGQQRPCQDFPWDQGEEGDPNFCCLFPSTETVCLETIQSGKTTTTLWYVH